MKLVKKFENLKTLQKKFSAGCYDNKGKFKMVFILVAEPHLGDSKTSNTGTINPNVIYYFHLQNCSKGGVFLTH